MPGSVTKGGSGSKAPQGADIVTPKGANIFLGIGIAVVAVVAVAGLVFTFTRPGPEKEVLFGPVGKFTAKAYKEKLGKAEKQKRGTGEKYYLGKQYDPVDCYDIDLYGANYSGNKRRSKSGRPCISWAETRAHVGSKNAFGEPVFGVKALYGMGACANPAHVFYATMIWCWTSLEPLEFEECDVPKCAREPGRFSQG